MVHQSRGLPSSTQEAASIHLIRAEEDDLEYLEDLLGLFGESLLPELKDCRLIDSVFVPVSQRGRGVGTKLLATECRRADKAKLWLIAHAYPWEAMEDAPEKETIDFSELARWRAEEFDKRRDRLVRFYERAGFVHAGDGWCYRRPSRKK